MRGTTVTTISSPISPPTSASPQIPLTKTYNSNREQIADKANVVASLNNTGNHLYQNFNQMNKPAPPVAQNGGTTKPDIKPNGTHTPPANSLLNGANSSPQASKSSLSNGASKQRTLDGYVGFANLPNQVYR